MSSDSDRPGDARRRARGASLLLALFVACSPPQRDGVEVATSEPDTLDPPAAVGAFAPRLSIDRGVPLLSWLEPDRESGHLLRFAHFRDGLWSAARTVAEGDDFFANWADTPSVVAAPDGTLRAHWLQKTGVETYSYSIALATSEDGGESWTRGGFLNTDSTMTEHGFVSFASQPEVGLVAIWLDGREMATGGAMTLRGAADGEPSAVLDERVCECCATDAATTGSGDVVVAYRDRSPEEERDVAIVRRRAGVWSAPTPLHEDGWRIDGCPVNGPAVAASEARVAVAWFTAADDRPRVQIAFSTDHGESFSAPLLLDEGEPLGRVDVVWVGETAVVSWLGREGEGASLSLRSVEADGALGETQVLARTTASRASGVPVLAAHDHELFVAWTEAAEGSDLRLRFRSLAVAAF